MANIVVEDRAGEDAPGGHLFVRNGEAEVVADGVVLVSQFLISIFYFCAFLDQDNQYTLFR